ncbi:helix-turn-helix transcriptional regulator [Oculatella sp. LEGE 06141]|uniref:ArsR/SmtB family transcription factor n=1 Tax=Oculatella sp. LEGE 06141 TaxID=1828648 RepID=UPI0018818583|nr:metalloregulator ArsR/SmtB family transcription factor [Oculatella sp. LEGE 06141]MBE9177307.1 helix-turn-helix transcriptional regulator [Oculatella sp. LEGE 06141]
MTATQFHKVAKALADPRRFEILKIIAASDELSCGAIGAQLPVAQPTISHHLKELANAGLIEPRKEGQHCYYRLHPKVLADYIKALQQLTYQLQSL